MLPLRLTEPEIDELLEARLIATLASINPNGSVHLVAMWFRRDGDALLFPTNHTTRKAKNFRARPFGTVLVDRSRRGLDLRGVQIKGPVELIEGEAAKRLNRSIHERYLDPAAFEAEAVRAYLGSGDDVTVRLTIERISSFNLADTPQGQALAATGAAYPLD